MPDRIVRDELWLSERFLDLPTDAARLAFLRFLSICDDFGNFEGGPRRLYRLLHGCTQIKTEEASATTIDALMSCDLIRRYEADGREFFHIPRFSSHRQYKSRAYPCSPWCDPNEKLGKDTRSITIKGLAKTLLPRSSLVAEGVGVGVGVGEEKPSVRNRKPRESKAPMTSAKQAIEIFEVSDRMANWAARLGIHPDRVMPETDAMFDHHIAKASKFADWDATWRNWMRNAVKFAKT